MISKITTVEEPFNFIDTQESGPFSIWEHEHRFEESKYGVVAHDIVKFKLPLGIFGRVFGSWLVKFQLIKIFEFREKQLTKIFKK